MRGRKMELKDFNEIVSGYDFEKVEIEKGILKITVAENKQLMKGFDLNPLSKAA